MFQTRSAEEVPQPSDRCAYYGRVSTPAQHIEDQREHVFRWCERNNITLPDDRRFEDHEKRHRSDKRKDFQRLLEACRAEQLDWIIIASFDRWGISDVDEFFEFRRQLKATGVKLWSVIDNVNLTSVEEGTYFRLVALAVGSTRYCEQQAEKNVMTMVKMAQDGWAATGNAPFGTDLVCYKTNDLDHPLFRVVRMRYKNPHLYRIIQADCSETSSTRMPLRDKKLTGYRFAPSIDPERLKAVRLIYELYDNGMVFKAISDSLFAQGLQHYDKPFSFNAIQTILSNPVYIGMPAWGKVGVGHYRILKDGEPTAPKRKPKDIQHIIKTKDQRAVPISPIFEPIVDPELWERVQSKLEGRKVGNPAFGKTRTKDRTHHPLNGKLVCPDCGQPMVLGSSMPKSENKDKGEARKRYFLCGTYRKSMRKLCHANSVPWSKIDEATDKLLETVCDRLTALTTKPTIAASLLKEKWAKETELGKVICRVVNAYVFGVDSESFDPEHDQGVLDFVRERLGQGASPLSATKRNPEEIDLIPWSIEYYNHQFAEASSVHQRELDDIHAELDRLSDEIMRGIKSDRVRDNIHRRIEELETKKRQVQPKLVSLTGSIDALRNQLHAVMKTIESADAIGKAKLLESFIDRVVPRFVGEPIPGHGRAIDFEFIPKNTANNVMPQPMKIDDTRRGRGSSRPPG